MKLGRTRLSEAAGGHEFAHLDAARIAVAVMPLLSKQVVIRQIDIDGLAVTVIKKKDGTLNIADLVATDNKGVAPAKQAATPTTAPLSAFDIAGMRVTGARLDWRDEQAGSHLTLDPLDISTGAVRVADGQARIEAFRFGVKGKAGASSFALQLATPVAFDLARQTLELAQIAGQLELSDPRLPMQTLALTLSGSASADLAQQTATVQFESRLDASQIKAQVDVARFAPLAFAFDLGIDQLDIDKYLPPTKPDDPAPTAKIDLSALKGLDFKGKVQIGRLVAAGIKADDLHLRLAAQGGRLDIAPYSAAFYGGRLEGTLSADAHGNRFVLQQTLVNTAIQPLLRDLIDKDLLSGRGDVSLDIRAQGDNVDAVRKSLAGTAQIALADGAIKGINLGQKLREAQALLQGGKNLAVAGDSTQQTDFSELSASFRLARGVARNDDLLAKSPLLRLAGAGDIDIGNSRLDYLLKTSVVATTQGQGGRERDRLTGVTVPVRLTGSFAQPEWQLELGSLLQEATQGRIEEKQAAIKQRLEDKVQDRLKGLFGR